MDIRDRPFRFHLAALTCFPVGQVDADLTAPRLDGLAARVVKMLAFAIREMKELQ